MGTHEVKGRHCQTVSQGPAHGIKWDEVADRQAWSPNTVQVGLIGRQVAGNSFWIVGGDGDIRLLGVTGWDAVVDASGGGDYLLISEAVAAGARSIYVRKGTYVEPNAITLLESTHVVGAGIGLVDIDFSGASRGFVIDGSGRYINTGTISVASGSDAVVGVGTSFSALEPGDWIQLGTSWAAIASIESDTALTLSELYRGTAIAGVAFVAQSVFDGGSISGIGISGSYGAGIYVNQAHHFILSKVEIEAAAQVSEAGISINNSFEIFVVNCSSEDCGNRGLELESATQVFIIACLQKGCAAEGMYISNSKDVNIADCISVANGAAGVRLLGTSERIGLVGQTSSYNSGDGVLTGNSTISANITGGTFERNGGDGLQFGGDSNVVSSCLLRYNAGNGIQAGDEAVISNCHIDYSGNMGIQAQNDNEVTISGNLVHNSTNEGIRVGTDNAITGCRIFNSGTVGIDIRGSRCSVVGNRVSDSGTYGIEIKNGVQDTAVGFNQLTGNTSGGLNDLSGVGTIVGGAQTNVDA